MASFNRVILLGNLTKDPELRYLPSGAAIANLRIATNRAYTDRQSGERKEETCFVDVIAWNKQAELCGEYLSKGSPVFIEGRLQYKAWENELGQKRSRHEVVAERIEFLGARQPKQDVTDTATASSEEKIVDAEDVSKDDIPF